MGVDLDCLSLVGIMALSLLASRLQTLVAGWGVRERNLFTSFGVSSEKALAISITFGFAEIAGPAIALIGIRLVGLLKSDQNI